MSLDQPQNNKMIQTAPAKKEFHFSATSEHFAEVVYAASIEEAETIYHRVKRLISAPTTAPASTVPQNQEDEKDVA
jgi:hypothetical protein